MIFGGCSELCCSVPFQVKRVNKDGMGEYTCRP
jgi:hypothetical protein